MPYWYYGAGIAAAACLAAAIVRAVNVHRQRKLRDFTRKLETVLQPRETIKVTCPNRGGRWTLTSRRLLLDTKEGFTAVPFSKIKKLQGLDREGKSTRSAAKMTRMTITTAQQSYTLDNTCPEFTQLVNLLKRQVGKKRKKAK